MPLTQANSIEYTLDLFAFLCHNSISLCKVEYYSNLLISISLFDFHDLLGT